MVDEIGATGATNGNNNAPQKEAEGVPLQSGAPSSQDGLAAEVGLTKPTPPASAAAPAPEERSLEGDIAKILQSTKLPERRTDQKTEPKKFDTTPTQSTREDELVIKAPSAPPRPAEEEHMGAVHTLRQDLEEVVRDNKISLVRAAALEQEKRKPEPIDTPERPSSGIGTKVGIALLLLFLGVSALGGVYYVAQMQTAPQPKAANDSIVFAEVTQSVPLDGEPSTIRAKLAQLRQSAGGTLGSITRIVPTVSTADGADAQSGQRPATLSEFFKAIGAEPPDELMRAVSSDFFLGIHTVDKNAPILVIPVVSYDHAFRGMLDWEKTMNGELSPLFTSVPPLAAGPDGIPQTRTFTDVVMRNYDVRALKDDNGDIELYYSFPTRTILIIAESPYSFPEVLSRLQAERRL